MKSFIFRILLLALLAVFSFPFPAGANKNGEQKPNIADILITTSQTDLLLFCTIRNSFTPDMIEGVHNGIPVTFTFLIQLEKIRRNWPDATLAEMSIHHTLTYDPVKQKYTITQSERNALPTVTDSLDKAVGVMSELSGIRIIPLAELEPDRPYALHVKATLAEKTLPLNMHYLVPFISLWDFETEWRTIEFTY